MSRTLSHAEEAARKGSFMDLFGQDWCLSVYPAFALDKLKFSFYRKGKAGQGFDIYMDVVKFGAPSFDAWAYDALHGVMQRALAKEKAEGEQYPKAYAFVTGENGSKTLGIANARKEGLLLLNAGTIGPDGKKTYANVQCTFADIRRLSADVTDAYASRRRELLKLTLKASEEWRSRSAEQADRSAADPVVASEVPAAATQPAAAMPEPAAEGELHLKLMSSSALLHSRKDDEPVWFVKAVTEDGKNVLIRFDERGLQVPAGLWPKFREKAAAPGVRFSAVVKDAGNGVFLFRSFAGAAS